MLRQLFLPPSPSKIGEKGKGKFWKIVIAIFLTIVRNRNRKIMQDRSIVIRGNRRRNPLESRVIFARGHKVLDGCTKKASSMIKKVEILEKWKRGWTVPSPVLLLLLLHHPSPFFFSSGGKDSEDSATLWVTLASRIVYRVMSLHTGASAPLSFSLSPDPSPSVPFHSILPRSRHCSAVPFIRNKVSSDPAQCTPVFLGSLYLFLSSSSALSLLQPSLSTPFAKSLCYRRSSSRVQDRFERRRSFLVHQTTGLEKNVSVAWQHACQTKHSSRGYVLVYYFAIDEPFFFFFRFLDRFWIVIVVYR